MISDHTIIHGYLLKTEYHPQNLNAYLSSTDVSFLAHSYLSVSAYDSRGNVSLARP